jgi:cell division protein FtsW (lipid II flippase)
MAPLLHPSRATRWAHPDLLEFVLLVLVLLALAWQFHALQDGGAEDADNNRYTHDLALRAAPLHGYGQAQVNALCQPEGATSSMLPPRLAWLWSSACAAAKAAPRAQAAQTAPPSTLQDLPAALQNDYAAVQKAIAQGLADRLQQAAPLAKRWAEGVLPEHQRQDLARLQQQMARYRSGYQMGSEAGAGAGLVAGLGGDAGSSTLACAWVELSLRAQQSKNRPDHSTALANQLALVQGAPQRLWWPAGPSANQWVAQTQALAACRALGPPQTVVNQAAALVRQVRDGARLANKASAMQRLQTQAPLLLAGWSLLTWVLLSLARRTRRPLRFLPVALVGWAVAGAVSGLVAPDSGLALPSTVWLFAVGAALALAAAARLPALARSTLFSPCSPQRAVSCWAFPGLVFFVGLGWWLVMDLAQNGHLQNRYIALRHTWAVLAALVSVSVLPVLAQGLARLGLRVAGLLTNALRPAALTRWGLGGWWRPVGLWAVYAALVLGWSAMATGWRQLTGEVLPCLLLLGVSWFFLLRAQGWSGDGGASNNTSNTSKTTATSLGQRWSDMARSLLPLVVHGAVVLAALVLTDDLGPVLVVLLASAIYAGAFAAQAQLVRGAPWPNSAALGCLVTVALAAALMTALVAFTHAPGAAAQRVAERLDSVVNPFAAANDQLAHVLWLGQHTPTWGYGAGAVPWCGTLPESGCPGIPAQAQSDYSFAVASAVAGQPVAMALLAVYLLWLGWLAMRQAASTQGRLNLAQPGASESAWLAWLAVCWVGLTVVQTLVTVAGNLGALPLTGVTWPFVSYGLWSMLRNAAVLGMVMHHTQPQAT